MNPKNRKPKPPVVVVEQSKAVVEEQVLTPSDKSCSNCVPQADVNAFVLEAVKRVELDAANNIAKLKKELADVNSVLGRQRGDLENLRQKSDADKTVIAGLKTQLNKLNSFGKWLYGIAY